MLSRVSIVAFAAFLILQACNAQSVSSKSALAVGVVTCDECSHKHINRNVALSDVYVAIECKNSKGDVHQSAVGRIKENGGFTVNLPPHYVNDKGELKHQCFAKLVSGSKRPCSIADDASTKLILKTKEGDAHIFGLSSNSDVKKTLQQVLAFNMVR